MPIKATTTTNTPTTTSKVQLVNKDKALDAINNLFKYIKGKEATDRLNILDESKKFFVNFTTHKYHTEIHFRPYHITLPHPLYQNTVKTFVIVKGNKDQAEEFKNVLSQLGQNVDVMSQKEYLKIYQTKEQRVTLRKQYDEFILDSTYKAKVQYLFGKEFFLSSKTPKIISLDINKPEEFVNQLNQLSRKALIKSFSKKLLFTIPFGNNELSANQLVENLAAVVNEITEKLPEKLNSIEALSVETLSLYLPFYTNITVPSNISLNKKGQVVSTKAPETTTTTTTPAPKENKKRSAEEKSTTEETPVVVAEKTNNKKAKVEPTPVKVTKTTTEETPKPTPAKKVETPKKAAVVEKVVTPVKPAETTTPAAATTPKQTPAKKVETPKKAAETVAVTTPKQTPAKKTETPKKTEVATPKQTPAKKTETVESTPKKAAAASTEAPVAKKVVKKTTTETATEAPVAKKVVKKTASATTEASPAVKKVVKKTVAK